jgi:competence protein ComEA
VSRRLAVEILAASLVAAAIVTTAFWIYSPDTPPAAPPQCPQPLELVRDQAAPVLVCSRDREAVARGAADAGLPGCTEGILAAAADAAGPLRMALHPDCTVSFRADTLSGATSMSLGMPIDVNRATPQDLEAVPGIGPKLARRIAAERAANGPFCPLDKVAERVHGVGPNKLSQWAVHLTAACPAKLPGSP